MCSGDITDYVAVIFLLAATQIEVERRTARHARDSDSPKSGYRFMTVISVVGKADETPVKLLAPIIEILPPKKPDVRPAPVRGVGSRGICRDGVEIVLPSQLLSCVNSGTSSSRVIRKG